MPSIEGEMKKLDRKEELDGKIEEAKKVIRDIESGSDMIGYGDRRDVPGLAQAEAHLRWLEQQKKALEKVK